MNIQSDGKINACKHGPTPKHTPEPWYLGDDLFIHQDGERIYYVCRPQIEADARRIVACVNACVGTTTDDITEIAKHGGWQKLSEAWSYEQRKTERQRDELLSAAKEAVRSGVLYPLSEAIAKAQGVQL